MSPENRDAAYLWDMMEAARDVHDFSKEMSLQQFQSHKLARYAVERRLEVIGEAGTCISEPLKNSSPEIPWKQIVGLRNIVAHVYGEIFIDRIWNIA